ncbi:uncharacterized protein MELLADRAFT_107814 [Melampsora larici-populina 98AG31]|uniref:SigF-like NTF2-like domain-containing protein n=1 Tax=Melampsora larici-populina (strain 98AG31 / pathotype 3-4-7) TaxID=747676 RepID=F4RR10_MELLP|nr:uncharacterized protein MELLADRAFT_107814 [Melampsora larici-populina 98AG31]EGG05227.1 hypothetical protein MELLADRAFT_107814 [Melampsora larici-populina 98AG31]
MDNPVTQIEDVVRSITEPYSARVIADNIEKYFTRDAQLIHPTINQPYNLTEHVTARSPIIRCFSKGGTVRLIVKISMKKCEDGKYRIYRQEDNAPTDLTRGGWPIASIPGLSLINDLVKGTAGFMIAKLVITHLTWYKSLGVGACGLSPTPLYSAVGL